MSSTRKMLINAADPEEFRVAIVENGQLEEFALETASREQTKSNIYKGVVANIEPSLQASFINYGGERHGFLPISEVHPDYFREKEKEGTKPRIQRVLRKGQELLVQVVKEETPSKGAYLTTYISLPGRFMVLLPKQSHLGVSRKIEKEEERSRLKELAQKLGLPPEFGMIIRTAGADGKNRDLAKDLNFLMRLWDNIQKAAASQPAPCLVYKDLDLVTRTVRDYFSSDIKTILVDDQEVFNQLRNFLRVVSPQQMRVLALHRDAAPIFTKYQLEEQLDAIYSERVSLKSGGGIVINPTEALVSIDVNSGRCLGQAGVEDTAYKTNVEAAEEIARQLRLRDLGGLVVIDFIDMKDKKHIKEVERVLKASLKSDKARVTVGHISRFGLLELSRQRVRPAAEASMYTVCPTCHGRGRTKAVAAVSLSLLRQISHTVSRNEISEVRAILAVEVANFLLNQKRKEILALEERHHLLILLTAKTGLSPEETQIEFVRREPEEPKVEAPTPPPEAKPESPKPKRRPRRGPRRAGKEKPKPEHDSAEAAAPAEPNEPN